jgi:LmbE family N-acetylglucosaminyl deacetylase
MSALQLTSIDEITTSYRHIFLSPHLDDVVYSCGGTLGVQVSSGLRPLVITVFAGVPAATTTLSEFALQLHRQWGVDSRKEVGSIVQFRRMEDASALDYIQADYLWLDFLDAIYRGNPAYYTSNEQLFGQVAPADQAIDQQLAEILLSLHQRLPDAAWYAPLGIGHHVDHHIVCSAADRLVQHSAKVYFYEDFPYVTKDGALQARLGQLGTNFEPNFVEMSEYSLVRQEASAAYASQISTIFGNKDAMYQLIDHYSQSIRPVETICLERYWTVR